MYLLKQDLFISGLYSGSPTAPPTPSPPPGKGKGEGDLKGGTAPPTPNPKLKLLSDIDLSYFYHSYIF